jgi:hypothetical protein
VHLGHKLTGPKEEEEEEVSKSVRVFTYLLTHSCDRIFNFLFAALCLLASIIHLFLCLHFQGMAIPVKILAIPSTNS